MALVTRLTQSIHLCFGLPLFLLPGGTISRVWSGLFTWPNHLGLAFLHLSEMFSSFSLSLMSSFLTWSLILWPHAHLHIFISVTSTFYILSMICLNNVLPSSKVNFYLFIGVFRHNSTSLNFFATVLHDITFYDQCI